VDKTEITEQLRNTSTMSLELGEEQLATLFLLLQNGFFIEACVGCSIKDFFSERLGLSPEYIQKRIQGIFLDGKPADHIETAIIRDGARLTISGTMPGLAGMALKSGPLAVFRHGITHRETGDYSYSGDGFVHFKLLNLLMKDMGPQLFKNGIYIRSSDLAGYLATLPAEFWQACKSVTVDDIKADPGTLQKGQWVPASEMVKLSVVPT
jgi:hypothetical protein